MISKTKFFLFVSSAYMISAYYFGGFSLLPICLLLLLFSLRKSPIVYLKSYRFSLIYIVLFVPLIIGLNNNESFPVLRDFVTFLNPILILSLGYLIAYKVGYKNLVLLNIALGIFFSFQFLLFFDSSFSDSIYQLRNNYSKPNYFTVTALVFLIHEYEYFSKKFSKGLIYFTFIILFTALLLSVSRTFIFAPILILIYRIKINAKTIKRVFLFFSIVSCIYLINQSAFQNNRFQKEILNKFSNSSNEIGANDYSSKQDRNANWRGFENFLALKLYSSSTDFEKLFGSGFGKKIPIEGQSQELAGQDYTEIIVLHNSYFILLIKSGLVGLLIFLSLVLKPQIKYIISSNKIYKNNYLYKLQLGLLFTLSIYSFTNHGWFHQIDFAPLIFLYGALIKFNEKYI
jgi:hypothetical protein